MSEIEEHSHEFTSPNLSSGEEMIDKNEDESILPLFLINSILSPPKRTRSADVRDKLKRDAIPSKNIIQSNRSKKQRVATPKELEKLKDLEEKLRNTRKRIEEEQKMKRKIQDLLIKVSDFQRYQSKIEHYEIDLLNSFSPKKETITEREIQSPERIKSPKANRPIRHFSFKEEVDDEKSESDDEYWNECFKHLSDFISNRGDFPAYEEDSDLFRWLNDQVKRNNRGTMRQDQFNQLSTLGFNFKIRRAPKAEWDRLFEMLETLKRETGSCEVPKMKKYQSLYTWTIEQRKNSRYGRLSQQRIEQLNGIGFSWDDDKNQATTRESRSESLKEEKTVSKMIIPMSLISGELDSEENSNEELDRNLSEEDSDDGEEMKRTNKIRNERKNHEGRKSDGMCSICHNISILIIDFDLWTERYNQLKEFKKEMGHCKPSRCSGPNKSLGVWVATMRHKKKKGKLTDDQIYKLEQIGFEWNASRR